MHLRDLDRGLEYFREHGFWWRDALVAVDDLPPLRGVCSELVRQECYRYQAMAASRPNPPGGGRGVLVWVRVEGDTAARLRETKTFTNASLLAAKMLEVDAAELHAGLRIFFKPARCGAETPWHQDEAYHDPAVSRSSVNVWIPLEDVDEHNGCLHFIPGSHRAELLPHFHPADDLSGLTLVAKPVDASQSVSCPLPAGGASVHHCRTLHYSGRNLTANPRCALTIVYSLPGQKLAQPAKRPWFTNRMRQPPQSNLEW